MKPKNLLLCSYQQAISEIYSDLKIGQSWPPDKQKVCFPCRIVVVNSQKFLRKGNFKTRARSENLNLAKLQLIDVDHSCKFGGKLLTSLGFHIKKKTKPSASLGGLKRKDKTSVCSSMFQSLVMSKILVHQVKPKEFVLSQRYTRQKMQNYMIAMK